MRFIARLSFLALSVCLLAITALAQKREQPATVPGKTICKSEKVPAGYKIVGETSEARCPDGAWLIRTRSEQAILNAQVRSSALPTSVRRASASTNTIEDDEYVRAARTSASQSKLPELSNREVEDAIRQRRVLLGMNKQDVVKAWSRPLRVNTDIGEGIRVEQWVYRRGYLYFTVDGILDFIQLR